MKMARCEGLSFTRLVTCTLALYISGWLVECQPTHTAFQDFPLHVLHRHLSVARHLPVCILLRNSPSLADGKDISKLEKTVVKVWNSTSKTSAWQVGSYSLAKDETWSRLTPRPVSLPILRCYLGQTVFFDYTGPSRQASLQEWLDKLHSRHQEQKKEFTVEDISSIAESHRITLIAFPDQSRHQEVEEIAYKVCEESNLLCRAVVLHPHSHNIRTIQSAFGIRSFPAVLVLDRKDSEETVNRTFYHQDVSLIKIVSFILAREVRGTHLGLENFAQEVLQVKRKSGYTPYLVALYASWAEEIKPFLRFLALAASELPATGAVLKFGLIDVSVEAQVVSRYIQPEIALSIPCLLVFHLDETGRLEQSRLQVLHPSPFQVFTALRLVPVSVRNKSGLPLFFEPYGSVGPHNVSLLTEGPYGTQCTPWSHHETENDPQREALKEGWKALGIHSERKVTTDDIPVVWGEIWRNAILNKGVLDSEFNTVPDSHAHVTLVVFIISDCSSCSSSMPVLHKLHRAVRQLGRSMYLANCTVDPALCRREGVSGFPTLTVYRVPHVAGSRCVRTESLRSLTDVSKLDYHGAMQEKLILNWFKLVSAEVLNHIGSTPTKEWKSDETLQLTAALIPRKSRFLPLPPERDWDYFWSPNCFRLVCERLMGLASCYTTHSQTVPAAEFVGQSAADMMVVQVLFSRRDGVEAVVMELGRPLQESVEEASATPGLHHLPHSHRYGLSARQLCEENHWACTDFLAAFARDHSRLPVTPLSSVSFHTRNSPYLQDGMPIVAAFVYQDNITEQTEFYQTLQHVGRQMYSSVVLVTVDVEMYPAWVGHFVPVNYYREREAGTVVVDLLSYPRFCIFYWNDHRSAAFFPPLDQSPDSQELTASRLMSFLDSFLASPSQHLVQTEQF